MDLKADQSVADNGVPILQYSYHGDSNQRWYVVPTSNGYLNGISTLSVQARYINILRKAVIILCVPDLFIVEMT